MSDPVRSFSAVPDGEVPVDVDLPTAGSPLDELRDELLADVADDPVWLPVPARPGWEAGYLPAIDARELARWRKASADRHAPDGVDELALALRILANTNVGLRRNGDTLESNGEPLTVRARAFLDLLGVDRPLDAVRRLYGKDGHAMASALEVLRSAGYGDDLAAAGADPTPRR